MGQIRNLQTDFLRGGTEQITYKRFTSDGTYIEDVDENVLMKTPTDVVPVDKDLIRVYDQPLKTVNFITDLNGELIANENAHFLYGSYRYVLGTTNPTGKIGSGTTQEFITDSDKVAKALSGNKYFRSNIAVDGATRLQGMLSNDRQFTTVGVRQPIQVDFDYYIRTTSTEDTWEVPIRAFVQETYSSGGTIDAYYDFENGEWKSTDNDAYKSGAESNAINIWNKNSSTINGYTPSSDAITQVYITVTIGYPNSIAGSPNLFQDVFIDNFRIFEKYEVENTIISRRKQYDYLGTYTAKYDSDKNILSNEAKNLDYFLGRIEGDYKRPRDTVNKSIEQIVTQEILNDHRQFMRRYEGTFIAQEDDFMSMHHKLWVDFGNDVLQEPVSCYLDAITYDVKRAQYNIRMHLPNQDDDVGSTYNVILG